MNWNVAQLNEFLQNRFWLHARWEKSKFKSKREKGERKRKREWLKQKFSKSAKEEKQSVGLKGEEKKR